MKDGGPAFPSLHYKAVEFGEEGRDYAAFEGMTLRDYFSAKAMQGILASEGRPFPRELKKDQDTLASWLADQSYFMADAMLKERSK